MCCQGGHVCHNHIWLEGTARLQQGIIHVLFPACSRHTSCQLLALQGVNQCAAASLRPSAASKTLVRMNRAKLQLHAGAALICASDFCLHCWDTHTPCTCEQGC